MSNSRICDPNCYNLSLTFIFTGGPSSRNDPSSIVTVSAAQDNSQNTTPPVTDNAGVPPMLALPRGGCK